MSWLLLLVYTGCVPKVVEPEVLVEEVPVQAPMLTEHSTEDGLLEQDIDLNGDGTSDVFNFYREREGAGRLLVRKETDLNWDGRVDVRTFFSESGVIEKEEIDSDFDARVDWVDHYQGGKRVMSEIDTDFNGVYDLFKYYDKGAIRRKERDSDGDGRIDFWEYFDLEGNVIKTGRDVDGDGIMDIREE